MSKGNHKIGAVSPQRPFSLSQLFRLNDSGGWQKNEDQKERGVIQRKNPQRPAAIEVAKIPGARSSVEEDACNQETGKNEKQVNAVPTRFGELVDDFVQPRNRLNLDKMSNKDKGYREATETVEGGNVRLSGFLRWLRRNFELRDRTAPLAQAAEPWYI